MAVLQYIHTPALTLAAWEWPGDGPPALLVHANGFHGRIWGATVADVGARRCIAVDLRGHGLSDKPAPPYHWRELGADLAACGRALGLSGALGVGHSIGGYAVAVAAALAPELFERLVLLDPVIFPPELYGSLELPPHFAARRRERWPSPEAFRQRLEQREPFSRWRPDVLDDYCRYGLLPAPDGDGWTLACPPAIEAALFDAGALPEANIAELLPQIAVPALVVRAGISRSAEGWDMRGSPTDPGLAARLPAGTDLVLAGQTHFFPQEQPSLVADLIKRA